MKRRDRIIGYIVTDQSGPLYIGAYKILWHGSLSWGATLFKSKKTAQAAIDRSRVYAEARGYSIDGVWFYKKEIVAIRENA